MLFWNLNYWDSASLFSGEVKVRCSKWRNDELRNSFWYTTTGGTNTLNIYHLRS